MSQNSSDILTLDDQNFIFTDVGFEQVHTLFNDPYFLEGQLNNDTEDIKNIIIPNQFYPAPVSLENVLSKEKYPGPYNFQVEVHNCNNSNNGYMYSDDLNKVYIKIDCPLQLGFKVNGIQDTPLYIRATPVYSQTQHAQECVNRCINHAVKDNGVEEHVKQQIIRCSNPRTMYIGEQRKNERLSVLIPLSEPQTGTDRVNEMFTFVCQNSCLAPGMNRRPILVILTLENETGIVGRDTLNVRVCCSPKRDMKKDLEEHKMLNPKVGKKRKIEKSDIKVLPPIVVEESNTDEYRIEIPIVGKHNVQYVVKYAKDLMAGEMVKHKNEPEEAHFKKCHDDLFKMMDRLSD